MVEKAARKINFELILKGMAPALFKLSKSYKSRAVAGRRTMDSRPAAGSEPWKMKL